MNSIFAIIGIVIGFELIKGKIAIKTGILTDLALISTGLIIQQL
jgi:hypothetical protein